MGHDICESIWIPLPNVAAQKYHSEMAILTSYHLIIRTLKMIRQRYKINRGPFLLTFLKINFIGLKINKWLLINTICILFSPSVSISITIYCLNLNIN